MPDSPIRWEWLYNRVEQISDFYWENYNYHTVDNFGLNTTGFSEGESFLSGPVRINYTHVMTVRTSDASLYLKGNGKNLYTGASWKSSDIIVDSQESEDTPEPGKARSEYLGVGSEVRLDRLEYSSSFLLFLYRLAQSGQYDMYHLLYNPEALKYTSDELISRREKTVSITFNKLRSRALFIPDKTKEIRVLSPDGGIMLENNGAVSLENRVSEGFTYEVDYYSDWVFPMTGNIPLNSYKGLYEDILSAYDTAEINIPDARRRPSRDSGEEISGRGNGRGSGSGMERVITRKLSDYFDKKTLELLSAHSNEIRSKYLQLPESLPERVRVLAEELTRDHVRDYDKIKAIETFLSTTYNYTLNTQFLMPGEDFVDNFLFELRDGYCTHFASAMAVLSRCAGIPAKYVEGYILPPSPIEKDTYNVTNAEAHAWVEIYFEGYGWKRFEPTAAFRNINRNEGVSVTDTDLNTDTDTDADPDFSEESYRDLLQRISGDDPFKNPFDREPDMDTAVAAAAKPDAGSGKDSKDPLVSRQAAVIITVVVLAAGFFIFTGIRNEMRKKKFRSEPGEAVRSIFAHCVKILGYMDAKIRWDETPCQYAKRVEGIYIFKGGSFKKASDIYSKACYSKHIITEDEREEVFSSYAELTELFTEHSGLFTRILRKTLTASI
jgi:transglutaminase-like putative cysteine protease